MRRPLTTVPLTATYMCVWALMRVCVCDQPLLSYEMLMPRVLPNVIDNRLCMQVLIHDNFYIVGFEPRAPAEGVLRMSLHGCFLPFSNETLWRCGEQPPCRGLGQVMYDWTPDVRGYSLPPDTGFRVGSASHTRYLVLQVHYLRWYKGGVLMEIDNAGIILKYTKKGMRREAGVLMLGARAIGVLPAFGTTYLETSCALQQNATLHPLGLRVLTHELGEMVSCYVVRQGADGDEWTTLGKASPRRMPGYLPARLTGPLRPGDILAARCTLRNSGRSTVRLRSGDACVVYVVYWTKGAHPPAPPCVSPGPPNYRWTSDIYFYRNIPDVQASIL